MTTGFGSPAPIARSRGARAWTNPGSARRACGYRSVAVRDSKDPAGPVLTFTPAEWTAFIAGAKDGEFDL